MQAWTAGELARFLRWAEGRDPDLAMGWRLLATTGMRRGEALALRWRDVDLDAGRLQVRHSVGTVKTKGAGEEVVEGPTKSRPGARGRHRRGHRRRPARLPGDPRGARSRARPRFRAGPRELRRHTSASRAVLSPVRRAGPPGAQSAGGGAAAEDPAARPAPHPR